MVTKKHSGKVKNQVGRNRAFAQCLTHTKKNLQHCKRQRINKLTTNSHFVQGNINNNINNNNNNRLFPYLQTHFSQTEEQKRLIRYWRRVCFILDSFLDPVPDFCISTASPTPPDPPIHHSHIIVVFCFKIYGKTL